MNRIRKYGTKWQVIFTPSYTYSYEVELLIGNWTDEYLKGFYIVEFDTLNDAMCEAFQHPNIPWEKMVLMHKSAFHDYQNILKEILDDGKFIADLDPRFMDPVLLKNVMFDRVMNHGERFRLVYHMNDIISFHITNPWSKNLKEIARRIVNDRRLKIINQYVNQGVIHLIGQTDLGTTYEICLWPSLIGEWAKWVMQHPYVSSQIKSNMFNKAVEQQNKIDAGFSLR